MHKAYGLLGISAKAGKVISGTDIVVEAIKNREVFLVIVAEDTSEKTKKNIKFYCDKYQIEMYIYGNIFENSKAIGKQNRGIIAIKDENLSKAIKKQIFGGE